jgi:AraC family transcriptional regulator
VNTRTLKEISAKSLVGGNIMDEVKIIERRETRIVGLLVETLLSDTRENQIIPKLQQKFNSIVDQIPGAVGLPVTYGAFIDPPEYNPDTDLFTWIAGVEVGKEAEEDEGFISFVIPEGVYAELHYEGDIDNAGSAYGKLYEWIRNSDYEQSGTFGFEMYSTNASSIERKKAEFILHFPVKRK